MNLYREFQELVDALQAENVPHAVCGGIAMAVHGYLRFTQDIDLLIRIEDLPRILEVAAAKGFLVPVSPMKFARGTPNEMMIHRVTKVVGSDFLTLDLVIVSPALEDVWKDRNRFDWNGKTVDAVTKSGLAKMKRIANRERDLLDLKELGVADEPLA